MSRTRKKSESSVFPPLFPDRQHTSGPKNFPTPVLDCGVALSVPFPRNRDIIDSNKWAFLNPFPIQNVLSQPHSPRLCPSIVMFVTDPHMVHTRSISNSPNLSMRAGMLSSMPLMSPPPKSSKPVPLSLPRTTRMRTLSLYPRRLSPLLYPSSGSPY